MNATNQKRVIKLTSAFGSACAAIALVSNVGFWAGILPTADPILHPERYEQVAHKLSFNPLKWSWREESGALGVGLAAGIMGVLAAGSRRRRIREFNKSAETGMFGSGFDEGREILIGDVNQRYMPGIKLSDDDLGQLVMMTDDELGDLNVDARKEVMVAQRDMALYFRRDKSKKTVFVSNPDVTPSHAVLKKERDDAFKVAGMKTGQGLQVYNFNKDIAVDDGEKKTVASRVRNSFSSNNYYYDHDDSFFWGYMWGSSMGDNHHYYGSGGGGSYRSGSGSGGGSSGSWGDMGEDGAKVILFGIAVAALAAVAAAQTTLTYKCVKRNWYKMPKLMDTEEGETIKLPAATEALKDMRRNPQQIEYSPVHQAYVVQEAKPLKADTFTL